MNESWPPPYELRLSGRAKHLNLQISPKRGLVITRPRRCSEKEALAFLQSKRQWVEKHFHLISQAQEKKNRPKQLPTSIELRALSKSFRVRYEPMTTYRRIQLLELPNELVLYGPTHDYQRTITILKNWVHIQAEKHLLRLLRELSSRCNLPFSKLIIRNQSRRWGSCGRDKQISLNLKLLFFQYPTAEYVMIHELCHTVHMNHAPLFWALVEKHCVIYKQIRLDLNQSSLYIPDWIE